MKNYSLKSSEENVLGTLKSNYLGRNSGLFRFVELLNGIDESCSISVNGEWGSGKTFFIRQAKLILDAQNPFMLMAEDIRNQIKSLLPSQIQNIGCFSTLYYDAWLFDNHDDPILSLMYASILSKQSDFSGETKHSLLDCVSTIAGALSGRNIYSAVDSLRGDNIFEQLKSDSDIRDKVKEFIEALIDEHGNRLVIFIDELDRCKPDYAVRFLERIKHYFDDDRVIFVFSLSVSQLQCTVKKYYGFEFCATRYLDKLFDLQMSLPEVNLERFMESRLHFCQNEYTRLADICIATAKNLRLSLREAERYIRLIKIAVSYDFYHFPSNSPEGDGYLFSLVYFTPLMLGLRITDIDAYNNFISGKDYGPMNEIFSDPIINHWLSMLYKDFEKQEEDPSSILSKLNEAYNDVFLVQYPNSSDFKTVGRMKFTSSTKQKLINNVSLLADTSEYLFE